MRFAHILVCHSLKPTKLFESIPHIDGGSWYVFLHGDDPKVEAYVSEFVASRNGNLFPYKVNRGLAKSWNDGIHLALEAGHDAVILLNDDLFFYPGAYIEFRQTVESVMKSSSDVSCVTMNGLESGSSAHSGQTIPQWFACCALTRDVFAKVGYFDENFIPAYFEDVDYARRASLAGMNTHVDQRTLVEHERSSTTRLLSAEKRAALEASFALNRAYFIAKWGGDVGTATFRRPFDNPALALAIPYGDRGTPYGSGFDRQDKNDHEADRIIDSKENVVSADDFAHIASKHGTDKWNSHWYAGPYSTHLESLRPHAFDLLEIGVGGYDDPRTGGHSLRAWKEYFPKATIVGLDLHDKKLLEEDRIRIYQGSQASPIAVAEILRDFPEGFEVIIDDGSHRSEHVLASFMMLWQFVKPDGWYIIEDLQTSYWPDHGGRLHDMNSINSTVGFLKSLVDGLNWQEIHQPTYRPNNLDLTITGIHFYHNIVFLKKGTNTEGSTALLENRIQNV